MNFFSKFPRNVPKTLIKKLSKPYARFSEGPDAINDVQCNITSLLLIFNKNVVFRQQMLFFHSNLDFYLDECTEPWKINICCWKTTFLLKTSNNDAVLLPATNIASGAHDDNWNQNPSEILRFSKNLDFWQFLKMEFEPHICCQKYDLSIITNWQHIGSRPFDRNFCRKFCYSLISCRIQFSFVVQIFSDFDKINNFLQQKQQVLFWSNMTPKVLLT